MLSKLLLLCCIAVTIYGTGTLSCPSAKKAKTEPENSNRPAATEKADPDQDGDGAPTDSSKTEKSPTKPTKVDKDEATPEISSTHPNSELYLGCYYIDVPLTNWAIKNSSSLTHRKCALECIRQRSGHKENYTIIGLLDSRDCICGMTGKLENSSKYISNWCKYRCSGNHRQPCGGGEFYAIYNLTSKMLQPDEYDVDKRGLRIVPVLPDKPVGCYYYSVIYYPYTVLKHNKKMTHQKCAAECVRRQIYPEYKYFGLKNGDSCVCAEHLPGEFFKQKNENYCQYRCTGNGKKRCGGPNYTMYYKLSTKLTSAKPTEEQFVRFVPVLPAKPVQCYNMWQETDEEFGRHFKLIRHADMGHRKCAAECVRRSVKPAYEYYGLSLTKCYCANKLPKNPDNIRKQIDCQSRCPGNKTEACGSELNIMFYSLRIEQSTAESIDEKLPIGFAYANEPVGPVGCYNTSHLSFKQLATKNYGTLKVCADECVNRMLNPQYTYFGFGDGGTFCSCGYKLPKSASAIQKNAVLLRMQCEVYKCQWDNRKPKDKPCGFSATAVYNLTVTEGYLRP